MALVDLIIGKAQEYDPDSDPLAKPFPQESEELKLHVELCARRYGAIMRAQHELKALVVRAVLFGAVALAAVVKGPDLILELLKVL